MHFRFTLIFVFLLSACSVGPNYKEPTLELPKGFESQRVFKEKTNDSHETSSTNAWWACFNDNDLNNLIEAGQKANTDISMALAKLNQAKALKGEAFLGLFPDVEVTAGYTEGVFGTATNPFFENADRDFRAYRGGLDLSWEIDLFGRVRKILESRTANSQALEAALKDVLVSIQAQIAESYIQLRLAQQEKLILKNSVKLQKKSLDITKAKYESGSSSALDLEQAKSLFYNTKAQLPKISAIEKSALNRIALLTGTYLKKLPTNIKKTADLPFCRGPIEIIAPAELIKNRPDIRITERQLAQATADIGLETTEYFPRIRILGNLGVEASNLSGINDSHSEFYSFGPSISWKILNAGRINKRIRAAGANAEYAYQNYKKAVLTALAEVENSLTNYAADRRALTQLSLAATSAERAAQIASDQYQAGALDYFRVLTSDQANLEAQKLLAQAKATLQISHINIVKAFGGYSNVELE